MHSCWNGPQVTSPPQTITSTRSRSTSPSTASSAGKLPWTSYSAAIRTRARLYAASGGHVRRELDLGWRRGVPEPRTCADDVERGAVGTRELARRRPEVAASYACNRFGELALEGADVGARERRHHGRFRSLEEVIDDLHLLRAGSDARQRVDEALQRITGRDHRLGCLLGQRVRLVVEDEGAPAVGPVDVEAAVEKHPVVLEGEPDLRTRACQPRDAPRELRRAVGVDERGDAIALVCGGGGIPGIQQRVSLA